MALTYKDIAKKAGVSISTVSRVINKHDLHKVSDKTREKIEQLIKELDFTPNIIAKSLVSKKSFNVAVAIKDLEDIINPYFNQVISGVASVLEDSGYFLQLVRTISDKKPPLSPYYLKALQEKRVDGIIILSEEAADEDVRQIARKNIPLVLVNRYLNQDKIACVLIDNEAGLYQAASKLAGLGHKRIVFMSGSLEFQLDKDRLKGYKKALKEGGLKYDKRLVLEGYFKFEDAREAMSTFLKKDIDFSAVIASDDVMALACINALKAREYRVPEDVSVIGFNDMLLLPVATGLSSMKLPLVDMGRQAAQMLLKQINKETLDSSTVTYEPQLIVRDTVAQAKS